LATMATVTPRPIKPSAINSQPQRSQSITESISMAHEVWPMPRNPGVPRTRLCGGHGRVSLSG
jgi:hypothetical protein